MPYDIIRTPGDPAIVLGVNKRAAKDQPQGGMIQLSLKVGKHVGRGVHPITFVVELLD